ncbi:hypothetical protein RND81_07G014800 [Saponaria officinalis]|uniref:Alkyl transferase n=1 Tax=Saponaria officinalis TaxID=3572 RepID=A0AAW1JKW5_SAPOF
MEECKTKEVSVLSNAAYFVRKCLFGVLSKGPIPDHISFIMDGNRRYAQKYDLDEGTGHRLGYIALMSMLRNCYELGVKYVTIYAFSIDNFKRRPEEVQALMKLIREKIEGSLKQESMVNQYGVRVHFIGDLKLLDESVRLAAEKAMAATAGNSKAVLSICIAYTSTNEIMNAVEQSCEEKWDSAAYGLTNYASNGDTKYVDLADIERRIFMRVAPNPDIIVRTSGESRLSNFLLWQSARSILYSPSVLWPEIGLRHLVWAILKFQRNCCYVEKKHEKKRV